ncbi:MAG: methylated-DNA--[protein]-cysteine S-methyltransferase [Magnetococcales bacterium]|nr:methylated-DNA--[protein]-cysteine S-methyltransferase [Magnetococcales bacterium]
MNHYASAVGKLWILEADAGLLKLSWSPLAHAKLSPVTRLWLDRYFHTPYDLPPLPPLNPQGTPFQKRVWEKLLTIPTGKTTTYGDLAQELKSAPRAVGQAVARNPLPIFIPCHRVVGAGKNFGGFSGGEGIETKRALLTLEGWRE